MSGNILQKEFTAKVELDLDKISTGNLDYVSVIRKVYNTFNETVERQLSIKKATSNGMKKLGEKKGNEIFIGKGRYGAYIKLINEGKEKTTSIQKYLDLINKNTEDVTFNEVIEFLRYPKKISDKISIYIGQYGYYMKANGRNYRINQSGKYTEEYCNSIINK